MDSAEQEDSANIHKIHLDASISTSPSEEQQNQPHKQIKIKNKDFEDFT